MVRSSVLFLFFLHLLILVSCGGKPLDPTPDNEKQGPGLFSGESGLFHITGKQQSTDVTEDKEAAESQ